MCAINSAVETVTGGEMHRKRHYTFRAKIAIAGYDQNAMKFKNFS
jgi:hypothetical protein